MKAGDRVVWKHTPRGGYGYIYRIPAVVSEIGPKRTKIMVCKTNGTSCFRWVDPRNLVEMEAGK